MDNPDFVAGLDPDVRAALSEQWSVRTYAPDVEVLSHMGDGREMGFVLEGELRVVLYASDGKTVAFRQIRAGEVFGEYSAIDGAPRAATVSAARQSKVALLRHDRFTALVETCPGFAWALMRHLTAQCRTMTARIYEFSTLVVRRRLARELLRMAEAQGATADYTFNNIEISPVPTHAEIAARISTHREYVSREIGRLTKMGIVNKVHGGLLVKDLSGLRDEAAAES